MTTTTGTTMTEGRVRRRDSIRTRVLVGAITLLLLALGGSVLAIRQTLLTRVDESIERELAQEVEELRALAGGTDPATGEPFAEDVEAIFRAFMERNVPARDEAFYAFVDGVPTLRSFDAPREPAVDVDLVERWTSSSTPVRADVTTAAGNARSLAVPVLDGAGEVRGTFVVVVFPAAELAEVDEIVRAVATLALVALVVASVGALGVAGRIVRPIEQLTDATQAIDAGDLTRRIPVDGRDEVAQLARTFNGMLDRLDAAFRSQRAFLDDVAHELRTPITIARGHLELLGSDDDPAQRAETVEVVTEELDRMSRYVDDLLVVAKSARPDFLVLGVVDVGEVLDDVVARAVALGPRRWVRGDGPSPGEELVVGDEGRIVQALLALVTNAVQHTSDDDRIEIGARRLGADLRFYVADTGTGVDPEESERLFTRFSRGAASSAQRPEGSGLGLAIVSAIAQAHRGTVGVEETPGGGATFHVDLPLPTAQEEDL
ncbi:sensor histidine kinase [Actinomarinicola tropica]|uniref:histidine kinase n=1 Tax=Actinomarinicola tropica TaxID=2789776 RepID=A0A5Q2RC67_9ACTN|nr:HAMP domain-containing sensor histidine kinase [Actinomarinicola tropica]QGG94479.1 HAMP domain-containing protein [Actinomarinicola tropica]